MRIGMGRGDENTLGTICRVYTEKVSAEAIRACDHLPSSTKEYEDYATQHRYLEKTAVVIFTG